MSSQTKYGYNDFDTDLLEQAPAGGGNVKVVVRVRPFNNREKERNAQCIISMKDGQTIISPPSNEHKPKGHKAILDGAKTFAYDKSYWSFDKSDSNYAGQGDLFDDLGKPLLDNAFDGYNNCIFAYGQTGSGKSYSMMGYGVETGVIPRICKDMFDRIEALQSDKNMNCTVEVSYLEIYNERVRDLLNPSNKGNLKVREHPSTGPYVEDLAKLVVRSFPEIESLMDEGNKARTVAATNMNETSSRSHAVFTLTLTQKKHDEDTKMDMERVAKISLVDLAGSERATSTGATGSRLKEGAEINRSLSTLGRVIAALADASSGKKKGSMVPYRDSVLTWLLKDSLGGNSMTAMIAAISPADINFEETLSTLRYADSAKRIKQHAVVNEDANARMIRELKEELAQLRSKLGGAGNMPGGFAETQYPPDTPLDKQFVTITGPDGAPKQVSKADIAEQLSQSEKLYQDLNQTWEQKLQRTEEIHKEREAALEELGISIEKGFIGMSTPKKMPHLVNLSDDPLLAECLVYNLKPGNTTVGNGDLANTTAEIRLKGSKILEEHCVFENENGVVSIIPKGDAAVMVNGMRVDKTTRLRSGFRIILGDFHIFRFNHPEEARQERAEEGSKLRQSMTVEDLDNPDMAHPPEDSDRPDSPSPYRMPESEYDWSFARREAARAILGPGENLANKTDEELNVLFEDLQRERANRRGPQDGRKDEDTDSTTSYPVREKYLSAATMDGFSVDTSITTPSTPPSGEEGKTGGQDLQSQLLGAGERDISTPTSESEIRRQNEEIAELRRQLKEQKEQHEKQLEDIKPAQQQKRLQPVDLDPRSKSLAREALQKWRQRKYVRMASQMLQYASLLKEAQILSQQLGKAVSFQFSIIDAGQTMISTYDMALNDVSDDYDDDDLLTCPKPCIAVRVANFKHIVVYVWSLAKLQRRVSKMRQMHQYLDRPQYLQHFRLDNPFFDGSMPQFSRIGEAQASLSAVFESRVQDFTVDVISPYTFSVVGILKLSLEPSMAEAPPETLKFNVVLHELAGFAEMEGSEVHAQLSVPRISEEQGSTTTQMIQGFEEGPLRFDSLHGMSIPATTSRDARLNITFFSRVSHMHLEKLKSWDDIRDMSQQHPDSTRVAESEYLTEEKHDVFVRAQIKELSESGEYDPVDVIQNDTLDPGAFQMHQGIQRRIMIDITHTCGETLPWTEVTNFRTGNVRLVDHAGHVPEGAGPQTEIPLKITSHPSIINNADGTTNVNMVGQWDSSAHNSPLLDRATMDKYRVQFSLMWEVYSSRMTNPLKFKLDLCVQIRPRAWLYAPNMLTQYFNQNRKASSMTGIFRIGIKPSPIETVTDLWRMDTQYDYVKGEEGLDSWAPRGVSLIRDFIHVHKQQFKAADIENTRSVFGNGALRVESGTSTPSGQAFTTEQKDLLNRFLEVWQNRAPDPGATILSKQNLEPPKNGAAFAAHQPASKSSNVSAAVEFIPKNPLLVKSGALLAPDATQTRWIRRYYELRLPFLHVFDPDTGNELNAININDSKVDHQPQVAKLLQRPNTSKLNIFAIYARNNAYLFATKSESEKLQWIMKIDESYFNGNGAARGG